VTVVAVSRSVDETRALAAALAELARPGDLILLAGELGAGKTAFAQGFGAALGVTDRITSPTFTLASQYVGRLELNHLDVYRMEQLTEVLDVGLPEMLDEGGVTLVEWGDAIIPALPPDYLLVRLTYGEGDDERALEIEPVGSRWSARARSLSSALSPWVVPPADPPDAAAC
jgi:tRNA threonylcarbamoyladenosine biosynthesis protein TsaE